MIDYKSISDKDIYAIYLEYKKSKYTSAAAFLAAKEIGIPSFQEYKKFLSSGYAETDYEGILEPNSRTYQEYVKFKDSGFQNRSDFEQASELGLSTPDTYYEYKNGEYNSVTEYKWVKEKLPKQINELNKNRDAIRQESEKLLQTGFYNKAFATQFVLLEKKIEESYINNNRCEYPKNTTYAKCFEELTAHCNSLNKNDFKKWRLLRNKITHDHLEIEKEVAEEGIHYIEQVTQKLEQCFK